MRFPCARVCAGEEFMGRFSGGGGSGVKRRKVVARAPEATAAAPAAPAGSKRTAAAAAGPAAVAQQPPAAALSDLDAIFQRGGSGGGVGEGRAPAARAPRAPLTSGAAVATVVFDGRRGGAVRAYAPGQAPPPPPPPPPSKRGAAGGVDGERPLVGSAEEDAVLARAFKDIQKEVEVFGALSLTPLFSLTQTRARA
jgi:hypothetical protein